MDMTTEELQKVLAIAADQSSGLEVWQILVLVAACGLAAFFGAYLKEKAKSAATKEDIEEITRKIEEVKKELEQRDRIASKKYELQYNACLNMLGILDVYLSHKMTTDNEGNTIEVDSQYTSPEEARKCHNDLLLTLDNPAVVDLFMKMMVGKSENLMMDLDTIRKLVREELGFGSKIHSDVENTWLAVISSKKDG